MCIFRVWPQAWPVLPPLNGSPHPIAVELLLPADYGLERTLWNAACLSPASLLVISHETFLLGTLNELPIYTVCQSYSVTIHNDSKTVARIDIPGELIPSPIPLSVIKITYVTLVWNGHWNHIISKLHYIQVCCVTII